MSQPFYFEPMLENPMALDRLDLRFRWGSYGIRVLRCEARNNCEWAIELATIDPWPVWAHMEQGIRSRD